MSKKIVVREYHYLNPKDADPRGVEFHDLTRGTWWFGPCEAWRIVDDYKIVDYHSNEKLEVTTYEIHM